MIDEQRLYTAVGQRLRKLREESGREGIRMTQGALASIVGLERTSITNIEKGTQKLSLHVLYRICEALDAKLTDVLPSPAEVQREAELPQPRTEFMVGGVAISAPPKTLQRIAAILDMGKSK